MDEGPARRPAFSTVSLAAAGAAAVTLAVVAVPWLHNSFQAPSLRVALESCGALLAVATVVALAGRGPLTAAAVLVLIVVIGQLEGHVLHPVVMSWAVRLHPVVVGVSVIAGSIVAGVIGAVVAVPFVSVVWAVRRALRTAPT